MDLHCYCKRWNRSEPHNNWSSYNKQHTSIKNLEIIPETMDTDELELDYDY